MRYKSGLEKKDLKKYLLKLSFTYCSIILISIFVIICIINPSMFISELIVILSISLLLFIIISLGSYISLLFFPFGVNRYYLQNNAIDYCINVHDDKIIISYNFLSNEGIKPILNTIYKKDINSIVSDINFRDEFSFIDRINLVFIFYSSTVQLPTLQVSSQMSGFVTHNV